jgi:succinate dehydrogenase / fumarate reductase flavoprotein subunit
MPADVIKKKLPSMWHQFKELADVDITLSPMEVGPTCHYVMGGIDVDPDTAAAVGVPGLFAAGEVAGGMHGSNRLGGNSLSDLLVFGRRAGAGAAAYVKEHSDAALTDGTLASASQRLNAPFVGHGDENPYTLHAELQQVTHDLVGIIRTRAELEEALVKLADFRVRATKIKAAGGREFNPGFHLTHDLDNMLLVSESIARSALQREESRGGHTRDDFPTMDAKWRQVNSICTWDGSKVNVTTQKLPTMPKELSDLFDPHELEKYLTPEEMSALEGGAK